MGVSLKDYYELNGEDKKFGYFDGGLLITVPFSGIPSRFGSWNIHGSVDFFALGDFTKASNKGDSGQVIAMGGIGLTY